MKVAFAHPTGNQNSRNLALGLNRKNMLSQFYTTLGVFDDFALSGIDNKFVNEIKRRSYPSILKGKTTFRPWLEFFRLTLMKAQVLSNLTHDNGKFSIDRVFADFDKFVAKRLYLSRPDAIYAYADTALETFKEASRLGIYKAYDLHGCYWKAIEKIVDKEVAINPDWQDTISSSKKSTYRKNRYDKELELADSVFVASEFCKTTLEHSDIDLSKIKVVPYGFPNPITNRSYQKIGNKIKILYVGNLSQLKGISYMFGSVDDYSNFVELTIIGSKPKKECAILNSNLAKHRYLGTLPNERVLREMREADIVLFPSLLDAFGMVITEAMSQGTPVITTSNTAGPELIEHGHDGFIIPPGDSDEIREILEKILTGDYDCEELGKNAAKKAATRNWEKYQDNISSILNSLLS